MIQLSAAAWLTVHLARIFHRLDGFLLVRPESSILKAHNSVGPRSAHQLRRLGLSSDPVCPPLRPPPARRQSLAAAAIPPKHQQLMSDSDDDVRIIAKPTDRKPPCPLPRPAAAASAAASAVSADLGQDAVAQQNKAVQAATQSTLLELLASPAVQPASVTRFLAAFPVPENTSHGQRLLLAKQCWEHLLDNINIAHVENMYGKMDLLRRIKLYCPTEVFRQYCRLEQVQLLVDALGSQVKAGILLCQLRRSLSADGQHSFRPESRKAQQLHNRLEVADLLMVVHTLGAGKVLSLDVQQLKRIKIIHSARHGSVAELESILFEPQQEGNSAAAAAAAATLPQPVLNLINGSFYGFPILFQPLIECHAGWLDRMGALLRAGANAAAVYQPWNCSALHMLFYRKSTRVSETSQVQAIQLLLQHGAKAVLNLADTCSSDGASNSRSAPTKRTALLQAASAGRWQACRALLAAGADADVTDSCGQSMLDYLFYLKHSNLSAHRRATAGYTCMQLYGMVNEFRLHALVTDELKQDCRSCGRCRFLLASCSCHHDQGTDSSSSSESECSSQGYSSACGSENAHEGAEAGGEADPAGASSSAGDDHRDLLILRNASTAL